MAKTINIFGTEYSNINGLVASGTNGETYTYIYPEGTISSTITAEINNTITATVTVSNYETAEITVCPSEFNLTATTVTVTAADIDSSKTIIPSEGVDGFDSITVAVEDIPGYKLIASETITITNATTSAHAVITVTGTPALYTNEKIIYVRIRDKAGPKRNCYWGSDNFFINYNTTNNTWSGTNYTSYVYLYAENSLNIILGCQGKNTNGIYATNIDIDGNIKLTYRDASSYTSLNNTIFQIDIFSLNFEDGQAPINTLPLI